MLQVTRAVLTFIIGFSVTSEVFLRLCNNSPAFITVESEKMSSVKIPNDKQIFLIISAD